MKDIIGKRFGKLVVLKYVEHINHRPYYLCKCDCGNTKIVNGHNLQQGGIISCGCYRKDHPTYYKHGLTKTHLYGLWTTLKERLKTGNYKKLNIKICDEWANDPKAFIQWALANGYKEEKLQNGKNRLTIDRINTYGDYEPSNCRFVEMKIQNRNKTTNYKIEYHNKMYCLTDLANMFNIKKGTLARRLKVGYSVEKAVETPVRKWRSKII